MVHHFNDIAYDVLSSFSNISLMDGYWMTLARPDNREVGKRNEIGKRLVHPGQEVADAMVRVWNHILLSKYCQSGVENTMRPGVM